ncbi:MAG: hypothetical protein D6719_01240 [Candidatus Dadabacteria bacterium]|nr:MAG: hypothetical protein D6719_01240 [Candidatus Dadabacteria bacterium]
MKKIYTVLLVLVVTLLGCSGPSATGRVLSSVFNGVWDVSFNFPLDRCELIKGGGEGLVLSDVETINQSGDAVSVAAENLALNKYNGSVQSPGSFSASASLEGNLTGDGRFCRLDEELAYNNSDGSEADVVYTVKIACNDGDRCDSVLRGRAVKRAG